MSNVLIEYRPNPNYYEPDCGFFYLDTVMDIGKLAVFIANAAINEDYYSLDEAESILRALGTQYIPESHDKYSFYDTSWELDQVKAEDPTQYDATVRIYLNA